MDEKTEDMSRRQWLEAAAWSIGGAALAACGDAGATEAATSRRGGALEAASPYRVDVHCHHLPDFYRLSLAKHGIFTAGGIPLPAWTPELAVGFMDDYGIQLQIVSISEPGVFYVSNATERRALARRINDYTTGALIRSADERLAGRFGGFAVLPLGDLDDPADVQHAAAEAERALTGLGMDGVGIFSNYHGTYLGDPRFFPLFETLNELGAMVFLHPVTPSAVPEIPTSRLTFLYEFPFDTTRAVVSMLYLDVFSRYPNIRWLIAHAGGTIPFLAHRTSLLSPGNTAYSKLFYDTALSPAPSAMTSVRCVTDVSHILFATDWPFSAALFTNPGNPAPELAQSFNAQELHMVERTNALTQFPRLAAETNR